MIIQRIAVRFVIIYARSGAVIVYDGDLATCQWFPRRLHCDGTVQTVRPGAPPGRMLLPFMVIHVSA